MEIPENRRWMYNRIDPKTKWVTLDFERGVEEFIAHGSIHSLEEGKIRCPCVKCKCQTYLIYDDVRLHLYKKGFIQDYYIWTSHGEGLNFDDLFKFEIPVGKRRSKYKAMMMDVAGPNCQESFISLKKSLDPKSDAPSQLNDDELQLQVVGGRNIKGRIYRLGSQSQSASNSPSINSRWANSTDQQLHFKIAELIKVKEELQEQLRQTNRKLDKLISVLEKCGLDLQGINDTNEVDISEDKDNQS